MKKKRRAAPPALGCLFWAALALVLVAVALAVREPVLRNVRTALGLASAGDADADGRRTTAQPAGAPPATDGSSAAGAGPSPARPPANGPPTGAATAPASAPEASASPSASAPVPKAATAPAAGPSPSASRPAATRTARLWFATVDDEGRIELAPVTRSLPAGDAPLRDTLAALLAGPTAAEAKTGVISFVPAGTRVRSVAVNGEVATIDFSEQFRFNSLGIEGLRAQLRQVVWAATEFPTVKRVQVLIEGRKVDYLAPEGAAVGSPLGRDSDFQ